MTASDTTEIVFQGLLEDRIFVIETASRDQMHPSRTVNTTYVVDARVDPVREEFAGSNGFAHGLTLTRPTAEAKIRQYLVRTAR